MAWLERFSRAVLVFFFVTIPVWIWNNIVMEVFRQIAATVRGVVRKNALWITIGALFLVLSTLGQRGLLNTIFSYGLVIGIMLFGLKVMFSGFRSGKKKRRR